MIFKKTLALVSLLLIAVFTSGCLQVNTGQKAEALPDGGFFVSIDKGEAWEQRTSVLATGGQARNFSFDAVSTIAMDPIDPKAVYFGTINQGLLFSYDRGNSWQVALELGPGTVSAIAIDPKDKCTVYASIGNNLRKTVDCNRSFETVFTDTVAGVQITAILVDHFNSNNVYVALSRGDVLKSVNAGESWQAVYRFSAKIKKMVFDPNDSRRMYADVGTMGIYRSDDSGVTWVSLKDDFKDFKIGAEFVDIKLYKEDPTLVYVATKQGILVSHDRGVTWAQLALLAPKNNAQIASIAVNPQNSQEIYYITGSTFYKSIDAGVNWSPRPIPSTKTAKLLLLDATEPNFLYLGLGN